MAGNVDGSVTSVSSDVAGKVVGSVGSVLGNVDGSVTSVSSDVKGKVVGSVASVLGNVDGSVASVAGSVGSLTTNNDKTGYGLSSTGINDVSTGVKSEINDLIFIDTSSESTGLAGSLGNKVAATYERFYNHHQQDSSTQTVMKSGSTLTPKFVMTVTNSSGLQTVQEATTA